MRVHGVGRDGLRAPAGVLDMGNAGTAIRLSMGLLAGQQFDSTLVGDASLDAAADGARGHAAARMGAQITPRRVGRRSILHGARRAARRSTMRLPVASAQVKSALLLAGLDGPRPHPGDRAGADARSHRAHVREPWRSRSSVTAHGQPRGRAAPAGTRIAVPGDFSSAAFFIVAGALARTHGLTLRNVGVNPTRTGCCRCCD